MKSKSAAAPEANHTKPSKAEEAKVKEAGEKKVKKIVIIAEADTEKGDGVKQKKNMKLKKSTVVVKVVKKPSPHKLTIRGQVQEVLKRSRDLEVSEGGMKGGKKSTHHALINVDASIPPMRPKVVLQPQPQFQFKVQDNPYDFNENNNFGTDNEKNLNFWGAMKVVEDPKVKTKKQPIEGVDGGVKAKGKSKVSLIDCCSDYMTDPKVPKCGGSDSKSQM